ncbi:MAG: cytochrome C nitrite reductase [Sphingomonas bacterium]
MRGFRHAPVMLAAAAFALGGFLMGVGAIAAKQGPATKSVSGGGVTLTSSTLSMPEEKAAFPEGAAGELITNNCSACHSAEMILNQPLLGAEKWKAEIDKMRGTYHAQIAPGDDAALVAALTGLQTPRP